jgi:hypothetical protein
MFMPKAVRQGLATVPERKPEDPGGTRVVSSSHITGFEVNTVRDVLVRTKPVAPPKPKWWAYVVPAAGPAVLAVKILRDALKGDSFTIGGWDLLFLVIGIAGVAALVGAYVMGIDKWKEEVNRLAKDIHHDRALEYLDQHFPPTKKTEDPQAEEPQKVRVYEPTAQGEVLEEEEIEDEADGTRKRGA